MTKISTMEQAMTWLKANGKAVGANLHWQAADNVIDAYRMVHSCPSDPCAQALLMARINEYIAVQAKAKLEVTS